MEIITLTYKSTNCYLVNSRNGWIMIDAGWPDTLPKLHQLLHQSKLDLKDIKFLIITHFHPDHAGLAQDIKDNGAVMLLHRNQAPFVNEINNYFKTNSKINFTEIDEKNTLIISSDESRRFFRSVGIDGEVILTPGHSEDSISVIIDECCAFTGDLPALSLIEAYDDPKLYSSWEQIQSYDVKKIYPAHGEAYDI